MSAMITQTRQRLLQLPGLVEPQPEGEPRGNIRVKLIKDAAARVIE
jgi:hypothetical protein